MKKKFIIIIALPLIFLLNGCASKSQTEAMNSGSNDISDLLKTLIQKEKEINTLNKKLEDCGKTKK